MIEIYKLNIVIYIEKTPLLFYTKIKSITRGVFFVLKYSVCIDMLFPESDFYDRFTLAKSAGMDAIEFWKWSNKDLDKVSKALKANDLSFAICNLDSSDEKLSADLAKGILNAGRKYEFLAAIKESIPAYRKLNAQALIVLIGEKLDISYEEQIKNIKLCLSAAKPLVEKENINLIVEPLNDFDRKNYFLPRAKEVLEILREVNSKNIKILLDLYHEQLMAGNLINTINENIDLIGHIHIADAPGRHEPGTGEINYPNVFKALKEKGYENYIGFEFRSTKNAEQTAEMIRSFKL